MKKSSKTLLLAGLLFFIVSCTSAKVSLSDNLQKEVSMKGDVQSFRESTLDVSGPVPYLTLRGNSYEQGLAYGVLLRKSLRASSEPYEQFQKSQAAAMPLYKRLFGGVYMSFIINDFLKRTPQKYIDEMQGLADGSGGTLKQIALLCYSFASSAACTSVVANPTEKEGILHGRNLDFYPYLMGKSPVLVKYESTEGPSLWTVSTVGFLPFFHGCNEYGISISLNTLDNNGSKGKGMPIVWKIREILEQSANMEKADAIIKATENGSGNWLLTIASANEKKGRVYNILYDLQEFESLQNNKPLVVVNHTYENTAGPVNTLVKKNTDFSTMILEFNQNRLDQATLFTSKNNIETPIDMWKLLRNRDLTDNRIWDNGGSIANYANMFSVVFDLEHRQISFSVAPSWASLRDVWEFNVDSNQFSLLMPADPYTKTDGFIANEKSYMRIENKIIDGTLEVSDLDYKMGPYDLFKYGLKLVNQRKTAPEFTRLLEKSAEEYPDLNFNNFPLGYFFRYTDPQKAISYFTKSFTYSDLALDYKLYGLQYLVDAYEEINDKDGLNKSASQWLELYETYSNGYYVPSYLEKVAKKMKKLVK